MTQASSMLLLHGVVGSARGVAPLAAALGAHFEVRSMNLLGHGGRPMPDDYSLDGLVDDVRAWLDHEMVERIDVFGYSLGGYVALRLAQRFPDRVGSVTTLATPATFAGPTVRYMRRLFNADRMDSLSEERKAELQAVHAPEHWRRVAEADEALMHGLRDAPVLREGELAAIAQPVLLMTADRELIGGVDEALFLHESLPNSMMRVYRGKAHPIGHVPFDCVAAETARFFGKDVPEGVAATGWIEEDELPSSFAAGRIRAAYMRNAHVAQEAIKIGGSAAKGVVKRVAQASGVWPRK